jgi:hypothetical protein
MTLRKMDDAPRDGTPILVRYEWRACAVSEREAGYAVVFWQRELKAWHVFTGAGDFDSEMFWPTCVGWMSLPSTDLTAPCPVVEARIQGMREGFVIAMDASWKGRGQERLDAAIAELREGKR